MHPPPAPRNYAPLVASSANLQAQNNAGVSEQKIQAAIVEIEMITDVL